MGGQGGEEGNGISLTSRKQDFTVPKFSISVSSIKRYCLVVRKNHCISLKIPRLWELTKFQADFKKSFLDAKINV